MNMTDPEALEQSRWLIAQRGKITDQDKSQVEDEIQLLRDLIRFHNDKYYLEDAPIVSDLEWDQLFSLLKDLEQKFPDLIIPDSPTQKIALTIQDKFEEAEHLSPMISLDNTYNAEELREFEKRIRNIIKSERALEYVVELKFDGMSVALLYENDRLVRGATRGDGTKGENVTANIKTIRDIPHRAAFSEMGIERIEVRGEVLMPKASFIKLNREREEEGLPLFANPRNAAAGSVRQLDTSITRSRDLSCFLYYISFLEPAENLHIARQVEALELLKKLGLSISDHIQICYSIEEVISYVQQMESRRDEFPFEIDGMVIKVNDRALQQEVGSTAHHPRWAVAYKFAARQAQTRLEKIGVQVGRTGVLTPIAELSPVNIGGVVVRRASLYNYDYIEQNDIREGDTVVVERAGDVIPRVSKVVIEKRTSAAASYVLPGVCPRCGSGIIKVEGEVAYRCPNLQCPAQREEHLRHFTSKDAMDIEGLGERIIQRFIELGFLKTIADIYHLKDERNKEKLLELEGFGEKSITNLLSAIEKSKQNPLWRLVHGLGIHHVGKKTAKTLAAGPQVHTLYDIFEMSEEDLQNLADVGPVLAKSIKDYYTPENKALLSELETLGLNFTSEQKESVQQGMLAGKTFVFTGELTTMSREEASESVEKLGGKTTSSVSKNTSYVVAGDKAGSKYHKATELGVAILNEEEFKRLINS